MHACCHGISVSYLCLSGKCVAKRLRHLWPPRRLVLVVRHNLHHRVHRGRGVRHQRLHGRCALGRLHLREDVASVRGRLTGKIARLFKEWLLTGDALLSSRCVLVLVPRPTGVVHSLWVLSRNIGLQDRTGNVSSLWSGKFYAHSLAARCFISPLQSWAKSGELAEQNYWDW